MLGFLESYSQTLHARIYSARQVILYVLQTLYITTLLALVEECAQYIVALPIMYFLSLCANNPLFRI